MAVCRWLWVLALGLGVAHGAAIYRWVDSAGQVHYSDRPHAGARQLQVHPDTVAGPSAGRLELRRRLLNAYDQEDARNKARRAKARKAEARRKRNCQRARETFQTDIHARYLYRYDSAGRRHVLSDGQRAAVEANDRAAVRRWCR